MNALEHAKQFLLHELKNGPVAAATIKSKIEEMNAQAVQTNQLPLFNYRTVERAKVELSVISRPINSQWYWALPHFDGNTPLPIASVTDVMFERMKQDAKWGQQNHTDEWWLAIAGEEFGELAQAILHDKFGGKVAGTTRAELVQLAAVTLAWIECIDRREGAPDASNND
jgi:NTP pyrophosphatase (non-canonical NTP hydrolase)